MRGSCSDRLINRRLEIAMLRLLRNFRAIYPALDSQLGIYNKIINNTRRETIFPSRVSSAIYFKRNNNKKNNDMMDEFVMLCNAARGVGNSSATKKISFEKKILFILSNKKNSI